MLKVYNGKLALSTRAVPTGEDEKTMQAHRYRRRRGLLNNGFILRLLAAVLAFAALVGIMYAGTLSPRVTEHVYRSETLPDNLKNIRIVYLSDIHQGRWYSQRQVDALIAAVNELSADVVILGGDYGEDSAGAEAFFRTMPHIEARNGVYAVMGDTDRSDEPGSLEGLLAAMQTKNVIGLVNEVVSIKLGRSYLYIAGADDYRRGYPDVEKLSAQVHEDDFVIFAGHSPDLLPAVRDARDRSGNAHWYDLALFGHTHGGQIDLFGFSPFRRLRPLAGGRYMSGWLEENRASLLISNGVGTEYVPLRLFAQPQIYLITLKQR